MVLCCLSLHTTCGAALSHQEQTAHTRACAGVMVRCRVPLHRCFLAGAHVSAREQRCSALQTQVRNIASQARAQDRAASLRTQHRAASSHVQCPGAGTQALHVLFKPTALRMHTRPGAGA